MAAPASTRDHGTSTRSTHNFSGWRAPRKRGAKRWTNMGPESSSAFRTMPMIWRQGAHTVPLTGLPLLRCCLPLPSRRWSYRLDRSVHRRGVREQHVPKVFIVYSSDEEEVTARLLQWSHRTDATRTRAQRTSPHKWSCCGEGVPRPPRAFSGRLRGRTLSTTPPTTSKPVDQVNASS